MRWYHRSMISLPLLLTACWTPSLNGSGIITLINGDTIHCDVIEMESAIYPLLNCKQWRPNQQKMIDGSISTTGTWITIAVPIVQIAEVYWKR